MLTESFIAATLASGKASTNSSLKDIGIVSHEFQPHAIIKHGFKKSSTRTNCVAATDTHIFAAQSEKAVVHVYNRQKNNQEATVPFSERITSLSSCDARDDILILGTEEGKLILWELATGRQVSSSASHLQAVTSVVIERSGHFIVSGSADSNAHVWSLVNLLSFSDSATDSRKLKSPIRTFSNHRSGISVLAISQGRPSTAFAVSASEDNTCHIWSLESADILKTILLPHSPLSMTIDPANRAIFAGYENGRISRLDLLGAVTSSAGFSLEDSSGSMLQVKPETTWSAGSEDLGTAQCLSLSYDGTILLSGHNSGKIMAWDVGRGRVQKFVVDLENSVTTLLSLRPRGLSMKKKSIKISSVTKPHMDKISSETDGNVPLSYTIDAEIVGASSTSETEHRWQRDVLSASVFPESMIIEAVKELEAARSLEVTGNDPLDMELAQKERLEEEVATLKERVRVYEAALTRSGEIGLLPTMANGISS